jgi:hypothetical protein
VEERIEKLVRQTMAHASTPAPVLFLCDAPWREIEETKTGRMVRVFQRYDSNEWSLHTDGIHSPRIRLPLQRISPNDPTPHVPSLTALRTHLSPLPSLSEHHL